MGIKYIDTAELAGKKLIARFDFNVPLNDKGEITDPSRIDSALPTIKYVLEKGVSKLVLMSHLGRPKGKPEKKYSLEPVATYLAEKLGQEVLLTETALDSGIHTLLGLSKNKIIMLENLRFHPEETNNDLDFARELSKYADLYLSDAFGVSHRKEASVHRIVHFFKNRAYAGFLIKKELEALDRICKKPTKPFVAIIGGAKVSDKIKTIERLIVMVDKLLIGGAMAYPFLKAKGVEIGKSLCSAEDVELAKSLLTQDRSKKIILPVDHLTASSPEATAKEITQTDTAVIDPKQSGFDIGEKTIHLFQKELANAKTIFWNGPMGFFEKAPFSHGTFSIAKILSELPEAFTVIGGGDSVAAAQASGYADKMSHNSTGGGASLEYIENGDLPAIAALKFGVDE